METFFFRSSLVAILAAVACSSGDKYPQGAERGPCYPNNTCNAGLTCYSDRCVNAGGGSGGSGIEVGGDGTTGTQSNTTSGVIVTTLAGNAAAPPGSADGDGAAASFNFPIGVAVNTAGDIFVADTNNDTIRKVTPAGVVTTLAGTAGQRGSADGTGAAARFYGPAGVAVDGAGNVFVADGGNIRKITPAGAVTTFAGTAGSAGVAVDAGGNVYVAEVTIIQKISPTGVVTTLAGNAAAPPGSVDGTGTDALFSSPNGVAVDGAGNVYVAYTFIIRKITPAGVVTTLAGSTSSAGNVDGTGAAASFLLPNGVAVDGAGNVYVADSGDNTIRKITPAGVVTTLAGSVVTTPADTGPMGPVGQAGSADGTGTSARFNNPMGVAVDGAGNIFVADTFNNTIRKITPADK